MSRNFQTVETKRGKVWIAEKEGDTLEGILTYKDGRVIGEDDNAIGTTEVLNLEDGQLYLVPNHFVFKNAIDAIREKFKDQVYVRITYKGKVQPDDTKKKPYHNYKVEAAEADQSDLDALADFESSQW